MIDRRIGKIKVRRGTDLQRKKITFEEGELIYTTDKKRLFVGDGTTLGGKRITGKNYILNTLYLPNDAEYGDIVHDLTNKKTYMVGTSDGEDVLNPTLILIFIAEYTLDGNYQTRIDNIKNKIKTIEECFKEDKPKPPDPPVAEEYKWLEHPLSTTVNFGDTVVFTAKAIGPYTDIVYNWQKLDITGNYVDIPSKVGNTFEIYGVTLDDISYYRCVAKSKAGTLYSNNAQLNVISNLLLTEDSTYIKTENEDYIEVI